MKNNYLKILLHLKQFAGDGKFHEIESILGDLGQQEKKEIVFELVREGLIYLDGGRMTGSAFIAFGDGKGNIKTIGDNYTEVKYLPFSGKLKLKGSKYLKDILEMADKNEYNINVSDGSTANVIISSPNSTINNKTEIIDKTKSIIKTIETDNSIDGSTRQIAISDFSQFLIEVEKDIHNQATIDKILSFGSNISSIGSLVVSLIQLLAKH